LKPPSIAAWAAAVTKAGGFWKRKGGREGGKEEVSPQSVYLLVSAFRSSLPPSLPSLPSFLSYPVRKALSEVDYFFGGQGGG